MLHFPGLTPPGYFLTPLRGWKARWYKGLGASAGTGDQNHPRAPRGRRRAFGALISSLCRI
jgi:hypothetical protein